MCEQEYLELLMMVTGHGGLPTPPPTWQELMTGAHR